MWLWCEDFLNSEEGWILLLFNFGYRMIWYLELVLETHVFRVMAAVWGNREAIANAYF